MTSSPRRSVPEIARFSASVRCGEQNPLRMMHTQQSCGFLPAVLHHPDPRAVPADAGRVRVRAHLLLYARTAR